MSRLIDADVLERDGWRMSRTVQIDEKTMELQTRKPTDFPAVEPQKGKWIEWEAENHIDRGSECNICGYHGSFIPEYGYNYCPNCGADMRGENYG